MIKKILFGFLCTVITGSLFASEVSEKKIKMINDIVSWEYRKVISPGRKPQRWQIYKNVRDPKIKAAILAQVGKKVVPFVPKGKLVGLSPQARREIAVKLNKKFPFKNSGDIVMAAVAEAKQTYPLVKKGDNVIVRYYRGGIFRKVSGVVQSVRENGTCYEIKNQLVYASEIREADRMYFDPDLNETFRQKFINDYQANLPKIKKKYSDALNAEALKKLTANEKSGYIFFQGKWTTAKYITDHLINYYLKMTEKRHKIEAENFVKAPAPAPKKKK